MVRAEEIATKLLSDQGIEAPPVPIQRLVKAMGATLSFQPFEDVSGLLLRTDGQTVIGVNSTHVKRRQRFTVAHEAAHLLLHPGRPIIVDKSVRVNLRDSTSGLATDREEIEANALAAELLMPSEWVRREVEKILRKRPQVLDDNLVEELADLFEVSSQAMSFRLLNLGLRSSH